MSNFSRIAAAASLILFLAVPCWAQEGVITGRVTDSSGAVLPGVDLTLTSTAVMEIALLNDFYRSVKSVMTVALANGARRMSHG